MSIASLYPSINPSLLLDFANSKVLDPRITFTRTTTATYYDGVTTAKAEENLLTYSQEFDNAAWSKADAAVTANATTAPDGTSTADSMIPSATNAEHNIGQSINYSSGSIIGSIYAKANGYNYLQINSGFDTSYVNFDITSGSASVTATSGANISGSIQDAGNGWYRCIVTYTPSLTGSQLLRFNIVNSGTAARRAAFLANGTSGVYLWGAQLEQRSSVTAYTATTSQAITNYIPVLQTASAGQARFDHNPTTGESLGLLIEEARTNLLTYSNDLSNAAWAKDSCTVSSNVVIAPDGTLTGDKIVSASATAQTGVGGSSVTVTAADHTATFFVKQSEAQFVQILWTSSLSTNYANFDILNGTVTAGTYTSASITLVGNGWYRISITSTLSAATGRPYLWLINSGASARSASYTGNGWNGIYVWGGQLEAGSFATSYIPTVASTVTRNADAASMTGTNFSSWFGNGEGTVYTEFAKFGVKAYGYLYSISNGATNEEISLNFDSAGTILYARIYSGGGYQMQATLTSSVTDNVFYRNSFGFEVNNSAASWNAGAVVTDSVCTIPNCNALVLAASAAGSDIQSCRIKKFAFYPQRVSNTNLVALTT